MTDLLQVERLSRYYGNHRALDAVSFRLDSREVLGLLGPNGAGKSSCLRILSGTLAPSGGRVRIAGTDLQRQPEQAKARLGYLPDHPPLYPDMRVDEYLTFCARIHRVTRKQRGPALARIKHRCGLAACGRRLIGKLSRGFCQRLGIAQALLHTPDLLILDEPTAGLDPLQTREIRALIRELGSERAVLLSSHSLPEVRAVCTRVQILHQGRQVYAAALDPRSGDRPWDSLRVGLARPPDETLLSALAGVTRVERLHTDYFRLHLTDGSRPEILARHMVQAGWGLRELTPERRSLEQVFVDVTTGDAPP